MIPDNALLDREGRTGENLNQSESVYWLIVWILVSGLCRYVERTVDEKWLEWSKVEAG